MPAIDDATRFAAITGGGNGDAGGLPNINQAILDNNIVNLLYQQPHLIPIIEQLIQQEQQQREVTAAASTMSNVATLANGVGIGQRSPPHQLTSFHPVQTSESPIEIISYNDAARKRLDHGYGAEGFYPMF